MSSYNLKFASKEEYESLVDDYTYSSGTSHVVLGTLYKETGNILTTDDGIEYAEKEAIEGYHVNVLGELPDVFTDYVIEVDTPQVVWAS